MYGFCAENADNGADGKGVKDLKTEASGRCEYCRGVRFHGFDGGFCMYGSIVMGNTL